MPKARSDRPSILVPRLLLPGALAAGAIGLAAAELASPAAESVRPAPTTPQEPDDDAVSEQLAKAFAAAGVYVEPARDDVPGTLAFPVTIEVRNEPLEYLLAHPHGAAHESLFLTTVDTEVLATAFLAIGAEAGKNVDYVEKVPRPSEEELRAGASTHDVVPPSGKPVYLYATWREGAGRADGETGELESESVHFHPVEDLVLDLKRDRTLRRHGWVWLGSRSVPPREEGEPDRFAARTLGNLASITFFSDGDALLTTARPECASQTNWYPNGWLLPQQGSPVMLVASTTPLTGVPEAHAAALPLVPEPDPDADPRRR